MLRLLLVAALLTASFAAAAEPPTLPTPPENASKVESSSELAWLLLRMEVSSLASQMVFTELSAEQMNWVPSNGSHTPRWNAEHLMGRQLLFFSQIYAELDPARHEVIDLNPEQMPPDYLAAHPDWSGADEAAWMKKVSEYVQGHAYLLGGLDLDEQAPGSRWKLRALLKQMDRHFYEHTANVVKKCELEGWPSE